MDFLKFFSTAISKSNEADQCMTFLSFFSDHVFEILLKTSDIEHAGTKSNVFITLHGTDGEFGPIHLYESTCNCEPFGRGQVCGCFVLILTVNFPSMSSLRRGERCPKKLPA